MLRAVQKYDGTSGEGKGGLKIPKKQGLFKIPIEFEFYLILVLFWCY